MTGNPLSRVIICALLLGAFSALAAQDDSQKNAEAYIVESEWRAATPVSSSESLPTTSRAWIPKAGSTTKPRWLPTRATLPSISSNHLNDVKVRFYGDTAVAQGNESWERRTGTPKRGRFVWIDTWIRRNGKWQIVAVPEPEK